MSWQNGPLVVYHGTDNLSATAIRHSGIDRTKFRPRTDFGVGFYVTTVLHQAEQWANQRVRRSKAARNAEVLEYTVARPDVASLDHLAFVVDGRDYYDLIAYCRAGNPNHGQGVAYDVVYARCRFGRRSSRSRIVTKFCLSTRPAFRVSHGPQRRGARRARTSSSRS